MNRGKKPDGKQFALRAKEYEARNQVHVTKKAIIRRDNVIAAALSIVAVLAAAALPSIVSSVTTPPDTSATESATTPTPTTSANTGDVPDAALAQSKTWTGSLTLDGVALAFELDGAKAPQAVSSFISLANKNYFNGTSCHRLTNSDNFKLLQCGDPEGTGSGGPGYKFGPIENAPSDQIYTTGTLAMARVGGDDYSMGSQFFILLGDSTIPNDAVGGYTVFGKITSGLPELISEVADAGIQDGLSDGKPIAPAKIDAVAIAAQ